MTSKRKWEEEFPKILNMGKEGATLREIAQVYGCSYEWIRLLFKRHGIDPREVGFKLQSHTKREDRAKDYHYKWGDLGQDLYDIKRIKWRGKKGNATSRGIEFTIPFSEIDWPTHCPILNIELDYLAERRQENSVSFDRRDPTKGYVSGNVFIISWRANRIKNDGTAEEHELISKYMK